MSRIYFATSNKEKLLIAKTVCNQSGIDVEQILVDINEIQGEDPRIIIEDKVKQAYKKVLKPIVVSDDSWDIPSLKGFPGPYMKSINQWFEPQDFIRLMHGIKDRTIILHQYLAYYDGQCLRIFSNRIHGEIVSEPRGMNNNSPNMSVIALEQDNSLTLAEVFERQDYELKKRYLTRPDVWSKFIKWYQIVGLVK
jgi:non-canonical purine NTP pyrophosphatase (RdgB/HAM1 family)